MVFFKYLNKEIRFLPVSCIRSATRKAFSLMCFPKQPSYSGDNRADERVTVNLTIGSWVNNSSMYTEEHLGT